MTAPAEQRPVVDVRDERSADEVDALVAEAAGEGPAEAAESRRQVVFSVTGVALCILAALLLGLVAELTFVGALQHSRDQQVGFAELRKTLAEGTAPTGQVGADGALLAPGTPVALMRIPSLGIDQVVSEGTSSAVTVSGPGHRRDSVMPGQPGTSVVFGRQAAYGGPFLRIFTLPRGATIEFTTGQGVFTYLVTDVRRAGDPQPQPLVQGKGRLTLVTAQGFPYLPKGALRVDAELQGTPAPLPTRVLGAAGLAPAERPMAGDRSAWVPLVFWAQALVLVAIGFVLLRSRWGRWQSWVVGVPVLGLVGVGVAGQTALLLPNLL